MALRPSTNIYKRAERQAFLIKANHSYRARPVKVGEITGDRFTFGRRFRYLMPDTDSIHTKEPGRSSFFVQILKG